MYLIKIIEHRKIVGAKTQVREFHSKRNLLSFQNSKFLFYYSLQKVLLERRRTAVPWKIRNVIYL